MVSLDELRHERRAAIVDLARRHGARNIRVYGSVARGRANDSSDLELLVEWETDCSLKQDFADLLGVNVDIGSERGLHWFVRDEVVRRAPVESAMVPAPNGSFRVTASGLRHDSHDFLFQRRDAGWIREYGFRPSTAIPGRPELRPSLGGFAAGVRDDADRLNACPGRASLGTAN